MRARALVVLALLLGVFLVGTALLGDQVRSWWSDRSGSAEQMEGARQLNPPPYSEVSDTKLIDDGVLTVAAPSPLTDFEIPLNVQPPAGAVRMQLADNVGFLGAQWQPLAARAAVEATAAGYQMVFARFEFSDGSISGVSVTGVDIDPTYEAATSSADGGLHQASWVRPFSATELVLRVEAGRIARGALEASGVDTPDALAVSGRRDVVRHPDRLIGQPLDIEAATAELWTIVSEDDPNFERPVVIAQLQHLARPVGGGQGPNGSRQWAVTYDFVAAVPTPLQPGATYTVNAAGTIAPTTFTYDPSSMLSPAVRVTQTGLAVNDDPKVAYLSGWYNGIGSSAVTPDPRFTVIDVDSGAVAYEGRGRTRPFGDELGQGDLTGSVAVELDFTPLTTPGRYQVCVEDVGCSYQFEISDNVWLELTDTVARAVYHQRSGVELGPPFTSVIRPRPYHPDDGIVINHSDYTLLEAQRSTANTDFEELAQQARKDVSTEAWGGHFDAGDWDRRINHLWYVRTAAMLVDLYPEIYANRDLNIPESGDAIPDILDEALWSLDFYQRLQDDEGAVSGGVEASAHPPPNATSWVDDLAVFVYKPDIYATYIYAAVAAEVSSVVEPYDRDRAQSYRNSATKAMEWAESEWDSLDDETTDFVRPQRNVAAASFLALTGESRWHKIFVETAPYIDDSSPSSCHIRTQCDGAWLYLQAADDVTDPAIRERFVEMFRRSADEIVAAANRSPYGWTMENPEAPVIWGLGSGGAAHTNGLLRAFILTEDEAYRQAAVRSAQVALGANPQNRALMTGVGQEPVRHPQISDVKHGGIAPWPGVPVYGRHLLNARSDDSWVTEHILLPAGASPDPTELPYMWQWYDVSMVAMFNEFTLHQGLTDALWTFGVLAATQR